MCCNKEGALLDRREMLRVKVKSLAEEARIIRKEESRTRHVTLQNELRAHRRMAVRAAARESYLAYGLIRGTPLERIERPKDPRPEALWKRVRTMIEKYGPVDKDRRNAILALCQN